ncbi:MAG: response regulator, partial [Bacteroidales bacterium]|nr:response regulator [Bacteroidales bacterium]
MDKPSVLLVDDDTDILEFLSYVMEKDGFVVHTATNGEAAFATAKEIIPDIIVLDMMMPGWDGLETCRHIRKEES